MKYRRYIIIPFILLVVLLAGCTTQYEQKDVYRYLKKTYALKDVEVSKERTELTGEDSYADYIWEVTADDITFHVKDDHHWGLETLTNSLTDDYDDALLKAYFDPDMLPHFTLDEKEEEGLYANELIGKFDSKEELRQLYAELESFQAYAAENGYDTPNSFSYHLLMQSPVQGDNAPTHFIYDGDTIGCVTDITGDIVKEAMAEYALAYTEYHFSDLYEKFTEEEVKEAVGNSDYHYRLAIVKENGTFFYDDLCARGYNEVSFGTLYEILKREGFNVKGNNEHYSFTDASQNTYEIAYPSDGFINANGATNESDHSCFLKNGVPVEREYNDYYDVTTSEIEEMFGLKLYTEYHK